MKNKTTKETFINRISEALGRRSAMSISPHPPVVDEAIVRLASSSDNLAALFAEQAESVGMEVVRCTSDNLADQLIEQLKLANVNSAAICDGLGELREAIESANIELRPWQDDRPMEKLYDCDAGITDVHAAIAETGTLVCSSDQSHGRGLSFVMPLHVAIVKASCILPDMLDYFASISATALPASQCFITGPSKTADIEGILITGVHGPERVVILLVGDG